MDLDEKKFEFEITKYFGEMKSKILGYLFAAHGAGLVGCLSVIKDYSKNSPYKGIGFLIALFALGMFCTIVSYVGFVLDVSHDIRKLHDGKSTMGDDATKLTQVWLGGLIASVGVFGWALVEVVKNFFIF